MRHRTYLILFLTVTLIALGSIAALHIYTDSSCVFASLRPGRYDQPRAESDQRVTSAERIRRADYDVILLGSSRTRHGFDDDDPAFAGQRVYNFALEGTSIGEMLNAMRYVRSIQKPKLCLIGLDLGMFDISARYAAAERGSLMDPQLNIAEYYLRNALGDIPDVHKNWLAMIGRKQPRNLWTREGVKADIAARLSRRIETSERWFRSMGFAGLDVSRMNDLQAELAELTRDGARVILFVPPMHASLLHQHLQLHHDKPMQEWLEALAQVVQTHNAQHPTAPIELWDFTGFSPFTTESLRPITSASERVWFYECSHMTPALGSLLLCRMLHDPQPHLTLTPDELKAFSQLGLPLSPEAIPGHIARLRSDHAAWQANDLVTVQLVSRFLPTP